MILARHQFTGCLLIAVSGNRDVKLPDVCYSPKAIRRDKARLFGKFFSRFVNELQIGSVRYALTQ